MAYTKKKVDVHIDAFSKYKVLKEYKKARSPITVLFCTKDLPDEWLIDVVEYKTKSGIISDNYMIIAKQLDFYDKLMNKHNFFQI